MEQADGRRFGDGLAVGPDLVGAAEVAVAQALAPLEGARPDLAWVFLAPGRTGAAEAAGRRAVELLGSRTTVGVTSGGVIGDGRGVEGGPAVAVWAGVLPGVTVRPFRLTATPREGGLSVAGLPRLREDERVAALVVDPYSFPVAGLLQHVNTVSPGFPLVGGLAGAGGPGANRLFLDSPDVRCAVHDDGGVGVVLGGGVTARTVVSQGCRPIGPPMVVTRADGSILLELAGVPAYRRLTEIIAALPPEDQEQVARGLHVGVAIDEYGDELGRGDFLIRGVTGADPGSGAVAVGDVVEVGQTVRFQVRDAAGAGEDLAELLGSEPARGALVFSCNGRGTAMFDSADHDARVLRRALGEGGVAGFFAAGEIGPVGGRNHLHAFTASVLAFR